MRRIFAQTRKELTQIVRDYRTLALALVLPLVLLGLLGGAISLTVDNLPIVVQDLDQSAASQDFIDAFRASVTFHVVSWPVDRRPEDALTSNQARAVLIIPGNFGRDDRPRHAFARATDGGWFGLEYGPARGGRCQPDYPGL